MKAISLLQPWATLVVIGAKKIETRSFNTKFRGDILIHASKKVTKLQKELADSMPFSHYLADMNELPTGKIIGKVNVVQTLTSEKIVKTPLIPFENEQWVYNDHEEYFGDYSPGRYGWLLSNAVSFTHHHQINGMLGLWDFDERICLGCGCMEHDCRHCIEKTGKPCHWVKENLCSACL